jgi:5'-nucleotidase (lipoprotein e(P4) family)
MKRFFQAPVLVCFLTLFLNSCSSIAPRENSNEYMTLANMWVQNSAEYRALCLQAYNLATQQLTRQIAVKSNKRPAIVLDIDETVLDNSPYQAMLTLTHRPFESESWDEWINLRRARAVPGVVEFLKEAHRQGFELFFISNRTIGHLEPTFQNMIDLGIPVKRENMFLRTNRMGKDDRRAVVEKDYRVALLIGDVMTDFSDLFEDKTTNERHILTDRFAREFGQRYIVLPNPMYGEWERAIYGHDFDLSESEKKRRRERALYQY